MIAESPDDALVHPILSTAYKRGTSSRSSFTGSSGSLDAIIAMNGDVMVDMKENGDHNGMFEFIQKTLTRRLKQLKIFCDFK